MQTDTFTDFKGEKQTRYDFLDENITLKELYERDSIVKYYKISLGIMTDETYQMRYIVDGTRDTLKRYENCRVLSVVNYADVRCTTIHIERMKQ